MKETSVLTAAAQQYSLGYEAHYGTKDLREALKIYKSIMTEYPDAKEAEYSRAQINNIVNTVVPKQEHCDAQLELALSHLKPAN